MIIDDQGFRANVGIIITNTHGHVLWAKRVGKEAWQFPQGGMKPHETPEEAMYRELKEEVGLSPGDVTLLSKTAQWHYYRLPAQFIRRHTTPLCIGQKQKWFFLRLDTSDEQICLTNNDEPEFTDWRWVNYWHPLEEVIFFKRQVYRQVLREFAALSLA
ncbi:MAG: hydrolase [Gammaproteobacteria bacterium]|jgi:putative (di)nucleoside polyphosphate hydrolase|nr:hydrolase [Gammaproteobacteria bacterium]